MLGFSSLPGYPIMERDGPQKEYPANHTSNLNLIHFNHANILKFCDRPFKNIDDMNEALTISRCRNA